MGLPAKVKTWEFDVNISVPATGTLLNTNRDTVFALKNALIDDPSFTLPWTVRGSSDSVASGMDAVDRWDTNTDLVWANVGTAHSWIVLRQTGIDTNFELCLDLTSGAGSGINMTVAVSPSAGFAGGSTTARPTATDEVVLLTTAPWGDSIEGSRRVHVMTSSDGQCTKIIITNNLNAGTFAFFGKPRNPLSQWSTPKSVFGWKASGSTSVSAARFEDWNDVALGRALINGTVASLYMGTPMVVTSSVGERSAGQVAHDVSLLRNFAPIVFVSSTAPVRGKMGEPFDLYFGDKGLAKGTQANLTGTTREWTFIGDLWVPWDGASTMAT
jgi:hypothetical protein